MRHISVSPRQVFPISKQGRAILVALLITVANSISAPSAAALAANTLGLDLFRLESAGRQGNFLLSPYSIATALGMARDGASGETRLEMDRVLFPGQKPETIAAGLADLRLAMDEAATNSGKAAEKWQNSFNGLYKPMQFRVANRLFARKDCALRAEFKTAAQNRWNAVPEHFPTGGDPNVAIKEINDWVAQQTSGRVAELLPSGSIGADTRLVLVNALHFKASWQSVFNPLGTEAEPFYVDGKSAANVPTMRKQLRTTYKSADGYSAIQLPCFGCDIHFLIILPNTKDGLAVVEKNLSATELTNLATPVTDRDQQYIVRLRLPKFSLRPPGFGLSNSLKSLGVKSAFDGTSNGADFSRLCKSPPGSFPLADVYHRAVLAIDEMGLEALAATFSEVMSLHEIPKIVDFHVDHPFLFAIQDGKTGLCLFLGRVTDPR